MLRIPEPVCVVSDMPLTRFNRLPLLILVSALAGCATVASTDAPRGRAVSTEVVPADVADRLFFGRAIPTGGTVSDEQWDEFAREEITPRFPSGLTVCQAQGQWLDPRGVLVHEPVMIVEIIHP